MIREKIVRSAKLRNGERACFRRNVYPDGEIEFQLTLGDPVWGHHAAIALRSETFDFCGGRWAYARWVRHELVRTVCAQAGVQISPSTNDRPVFQPS